MLNPDLLDRIIANTTVSKERPFFVQLFSLEKLLDLSSVHKTTDEEKSPLTAEEQFHLEIYSELLENLAFYLGQRKTLTEEGKDQGAIEEIQQKVDAHLRVFEKYFAKAQFTVFSYLQHETEEYVTAAVTILASVLKQDKNTV